MRRGAVNGLTCSHEKWGLAETRLPHGPLVTKCHHHVGGEKTGRAYALYRSDPVIASLHKDLKDLRQAPEDTGILFVFFNVVMLF